MAASCTRRTLQVSTAYATRTAISNIFRSSQSLGAAQLLGCASRKTSSASRISLRRLLTSSRFPVELAAALSLMPLHSANASALYTSLLSLHSDNWGCLSEGFVTPL
ncbi:hypothetical protein Nepgr_032976 [Nepenthes gracilis]|uniref:Uncharacterized protein n=1 Tax=Nepenthes gracilis TaxID=150966 RepID=A0AAD3TLG7_NEPGR|nr:hypothetical protein Nepgr_032976 [Nepenthes gracilis]